MTESMIERVERVIGGHVHGDDDAMRAAACAVLEALKVPTEGMMRAAYEAMFEDKWDGTQAPMMGAGLEAAINAALSESK